MTKGRVIAGIIVFAVLAAIAGGWYLGTASAATSVSAATATRARLDVDVTASGTLVVGIVFGVLAALGPARSASRLDVVAALHHE